MAWVRVIVFQTRGQAVGVGGCRTQTHESNHRGLTVPQVLPLLTRPTTTFSPTSIAAITCLFVLTLSTTILLQPRPSFVSPPLVFYFEVLASAFSSSSMETSFMTQTKR